MEVGPRDGLQNEKNTIPLSTKIELIRRLAGTGIRTMEAGSFVAPKWVPQVSHFQVSRNATATASLYQEGCQSDLVLQMANSAQVLNHILGHPPPATQSIAYNFLVPNIKGLHNLLSVTESSRRTDSTDTAPIASPEDPNAPPTPPSTPPPQGETPAPITSSQDPNEMPSDTSGTPKHSAPFSTEISLFAAATEAFSKANTNCTIAESLERCRPIVTLAKSRNLRVRGYVSVALGCPYEGLNVSPAKVAEITATLLEMGADEVSVADTTGTGTAPRTRELLRALSTAGIANKDIALHFHDTYGQALVNSVVGLEHGIRTFDSSVGGLGGCPYSKGATGNVATEDLVYCLHSLGVKTGVDVEKMAQIGAWISGQLGRKNDSRAGKALLAKL